MKQLQYLLLFSLFSLSFSACSDNIDDSKKIDGDWKLESVSGGFGGGGFLSEGEITISVEGNNLSLFQDGILNMEADLKYDMDDTGQIFITLDEDYKESVEAFQLGLSDKMGLQKAEDDSEMTLFDTCNDCYNYHFIKK